MSGLFAQIDWFWRALGWAGVASVALVTVMTVYVTAAARKYAAIVSTTDEIKRLNEQVAALAANQDTRCDLAEAMWCDQQCERLLAKHKELNTSYWSASLNAFKENVVPISGSADRWTPAAEELALWVRRSLPALYTEEDIKIEQREAPDEDDVPEASRKEYRALYWRKQMMDKYISGIAGKLESRSEQLRSKFVETGNPLDRPLQKVAGV